MIKRLVGQSDMAVVGRRPGIRRMAKVAFLRRIEVAGIPARSRCAVVTRRTGAQHLVMVDGDHGRPHIGAVAILADIRRLRVQRALACCVYTVVAAAAVIRDIRMIEVCRRPRDRCMAVVAIVAAGDMRRMFADGDGAVMAGTAGANDLRVVDRERR